MGSYVSKPEKNFGERFPVLYKSRYCDQENFEIAAFSNDYIVKDICLDKPVLLKNFKTEERLPNVTTNSSDTTVHKSRTMKRRYKNKSTFFDSGFSKSIVNNENLKSVGVCCDIYLLYQRSDGKRYYLTETNFNSTSVQVFSSATKSWKSLPEIPNKKGVITICSFLQKLYVIGKFSMCYDKHINKWKSIAVMNESREDTACTVFEGKIIVSGGFKMVPYQITTYKAFDNSVGTAYQNVRLNSVEAYDHHENKWTSFPSMLSQRTNYSSFSIGNKMFMIGGSNSDYSEVFDSVTRKFTYIENWPKVVRKLEYYNLLEYNIFLNSFRVVSIGYKIYFFKKEKNKVNIHSYDVKDKHFSFETSMKSGKLKIVSYVKVPKV